MNRRLWTAIGVALAVTVFVVAVPGRRGFFDVGVYHGAIRYWLDGGALYDFRVPGTRYGFTYPPFAALAMLPLAPLPWPAAIAASIVVNVAVAAVVVHRLARPATWFGYALAVCA